MNFTENDPEKHKKLNKGTRIKGNAIEIMRYFFVTFTLKKKKKIPIWRQSSEELEGEIKRPTKWAMQRNKEKQSNGKG